MHSAFAVICLLAASAFAAPALEVRAGKSVAVTLASSNLATQTKLKNVISRKGKMAVGAGGTFETIEISVGPNADPDLRCQALDSAGNLLIAKRNANIDTSFSDADKGEWMFLVPSKVHTIVCDPNIEAISADNFQARVILSGPGELATQTVFSNVLVHDEQLPVGSSGPYDTVELSVGAMVDPAFRCQVVDKKGNEIVVLRGTNRDTTFSDADKGAWTFEAGNKRVSNIICDPTFVAQNTAGTVNTLSSNSTSKA